MGDSFAKLTGNLQAIESWSVETIEVTHGICITFIAYMNSLVEIEDLMEFIIRVLPNLCLTATSSLRFASDNLDSGTPHSLLYLATKKIFEMLEIAIERLFDEEEILGEELNQIKNN